MTRGWRWASPAFGALCGCIPSQDALVGAPIEGHNHTSAAIHHFTVNRNGGPNVAPYSAGGKQTCCVGLPARWRPGLTVLVEWEKDPAPHHYADWPERRHTDEWRARMSAHQAGYSRHRAWADIAPYQQVGVVDVHFLPCDRVAVSAVAALPDSSGYPFDFPRRMEVSSTCPEH